MLEFTLGVFNDVQTKEDTPADVAPPTDTAPPIRHFNGKDYPYYEVYPHAVLYSVISLFSLTIRSPLVAVHCVTIEAILKGSLN